MVVINLMAAILPMASAMVGTLPMADIHPMVAHLTAMVAMLPAIILMDLDTVTEGGGLQMRRRST